MRDHGVENGLFQQIGLFRDGIEGKRTIVVAANLESLVASHEEADAVVDLVLEQAGLSSATFSPLLGLKMEAVELCATKRVKEGRKRG